MAVEVEPFEHARFLKAPPHAEAAALHLPGDAAARLALLPRGSAETSSTDVLLGGRPRRSRKLAAGGGRSMEFYGGGGYRRC